MQTGSFFACKLKSSVCHVLSVWSTLTHIDVIAVYVHKYVSTILHFDQCGSGSLDMSGYVRQMAVRITSAVQEKTCLPLCYCSAVSRSLFSHAHTTLSLCLLFLCRYTVFPVYSSITPFLQTPLYQLTQKSPSLWKSVVLDARGREREIQAV